MKNKKQFKLPTYLELKCPVCEKDRNAQQTPLWDCFFEYLNPNGQFSPENPKDMADFEKFALHITSLKSHRFQWACNKCIHEGKAIKGDYQKQFFGMGLPIIAYTDLSRKCVNCDKDFIFSAKEQQYWYEEAGFILDSVPKTCLECRKRIRISKNKQKKVQELLKKEILTQAEMMELRDFYENKGNIQKMNYYANLLKK